LISSLFSRSRQGHQSDVVLLLPVLTGEAGEFGEEEVDQGRPTRAVSPYQVLQPGEAEHLAVQVVGLYQTVAEGIRTYALRRAKAARLIASDT
jgi:hypothetical protein